MRGFQFELDGHRVLIVAVIDPPPDFSPEPAFFIPSADREEKDGSRPLIPNGVSFEELLKLVERAFRDYNFLPRLDANLLTDMVNLERYRKPSDNPLIAKGHALRRAMDEAIDGIAGPVVEPGNAGWRAEQYLHWRYREGMKHSELARLSNFDERHLRRIRRELLRKVTEFLLSL